MRNVTQSLARLVRTGLHRTGPTKVAGALIGGVVLATLYSQSIPSAAFSTSLGTSETVAATGPSAMPSGMAQDSMSMTRPTSGSVEPLWLASAGNRVEAFTNPLAAPPVLTDTNIALEAREADVQILPGTATHMWTYNGIFPGPTIRRPTGQTTYVTLINSLPASAGSLTLHNHGNHSAPDSDGQTDSLLVAPGASRVYTYTGIEGAGNERGTMRFYHDHRMDVTGRDLWMGLAGLYIIDDPADPQTLPSGEFDVPLMVVDRAFDANNQLVYQFSPGGAVGDTILVNGVVQPYFEVADRKYRLRILNAANFSQYDLQLNNGQPMTQIGTESCLLQAPVSRTHILLGPAERADVVIDFTGQLGQNIVLNNLAGSGSTGEIMQFRVTRHVTDDSAVPSTLRPLPVMDTPILTRTFEFGWTSGHWTINGLAYDPNRIDAQPVLGTTEKWILRNIGPSPHVIHVHDVDQVLVSRNGNPPNPYELMKESWNISGNQTVEVLIKFTDYLGRYVLHCHMVEHEDYGMMMQFEVVAPATTPTTTPTITPTTTPTNTPTSTPPPILVGHAIWQGAPAQPHTRQQQPITLTLRLQTGGPYYNYSTQTTDSSGFFTVTLSGIPNDVYNWRAKGPKFLANSGTTSISGAAQTSVEMSLMRAGDANNDNVVTTLDFNIMKGTLGKSLGDPGYDARADFNNDDLVSVVDFNMLRSNFGQAGE
jgi:spore coat protein A